MSKNMTRKGLAFGAGLALVGSSFAVPANAAITVAGDGTTPLISVVPSSGPEDAMAIIAADGASFSVTASPATAVMGGGELKFKVSDPNAKFLPSSNTTGGATVAIADNAAIVANISTQFISVAAAGVADGSYLMWADADLNADGGTPADVVVLSKDTLVEVAVMSSRAYFKSTAAFTAAPTAADVTANVNLNFVQGGDQAIDATVTVADDATIAVTSSANETFTVVTSGLADGTWYVFSNSGVFQADGGTTDSGTTTYAAQYSVMLGTVSSNTLTLTTDSDITDAIDNVGGETLHAFKAPSAVRSATDNSYVVDTGVTSAGNTGALELVAVDAVSRTVSVEAFVDAFADDVIGATEYASAATTLHFVERDEVTATTVLTPPTLGDEELTAKVTTSPLLNIAEDGNTDVVDVVFSRQDSITLGMNTSVASQLALTGVITQTVPLNVAANNIDSYTASTGVATTAGTSEWEVSAGTIMVTPADSQAVTEASSSITDEVVTVTTDAAHGLRVGDRIDLDGVTGTNATALNLDATRHIVTSVPSTTTLTFTLEDATDIAAFAGTVTLDVETYQSGTGDALVDRVFAGDYSAFAILESSTANTYTKLGATQTLGNTAAVAADVIFSTVASATVQGKSLKTDDGSEKILVKKDTASAVITLTVVDKDGAAVGAGRPVVTTLSSRTSTVKVNALTTGQTLLTDANGQVSLTVSSSTAADGDAVTIKAVAEGVTTADSQIVVEWDAQAYSLYDLNTTQGALSNYTRTVLAGSGYSLDLMLADQWYQAAPSATYRLQVTGTGSNAGNISLVDGKATVTATDLLGADFSTAIAIQKATAGVFATTSTVTISNVVVAADSAKITLAADASSLYDSVTADLSDKVAAKALVERDVRKAFAVQPAYTNDVVVSGKVTKASSGASQSGAVVTISGSSSILFSDGDVDSRGSITVVADTSGEFSVKLYSTTAMTDSVITVSALGESATTKVTFTGIGVGEGTSLTVTAPAAVKPASTFQVKAKLADVYGNGVDTAAGRVKVTYTGPGIIFGTLPTETDANGELSFSVLLGSNDSGNVVVQVQYDQNGDADYVDAKDLSATSTTAITASGAVASADQKVNAGSFKGYVALYAKGYAGQRMSAKVGNDWVVVPVLASNFERVVEFTGAGYTVAVRIYIDRVLIDTITVTTK